MDLSHILSAPAASTNPPTTQYSPRPNNASATTDAEKFPHHRSLDDSFTNYGSSSPFYHLPRPVSSQPTPQPIASPYPLPRDYLPPRLLHPSLVPQPSFGTGPRTSFPALPVPIPHEDDDGVSSSVFTHNDSLPHSPASTVHPSASESSMPRREVHVPSQQRPQPGSSPIDLTRESPRSQVTRPPKRQTHGPSEENQTSSKRRRISDSFNEIEHHGPPVATIDLAGNDDVVQVTLQRQREDLLSSQPVERSTGPTKLTGLQCTVCLDNIKDMTVTSCGELELIMAP